MKIDTGVPRPDLVLNQIPRERWESVAVARSLWAEIDFPHDCRLMKQVADEADLLAEELGYENGEAFIVEYLSTRQVRRDRCASYPSQSLVCSSHTVRKTPFSGGAVSNFSSTPVSKNRVSGLV